MNLNLPCLAQGVLYACDLGTSCSISLQILGWTQKPFESAFLLPVEGVRTSKILIEFLKIRKGLTCYAWSKNSFKSATVLHVETAIHKLYSWDKWGKPGPEILVSEMFHAVWV